MSTQTLTELERAVATDPQNPALRHRLGAHYAQLGMYAEAERELYRAISLNPQAHVARLQLGLLHLTRGDPHRALSTWNALEALDEADAVKSFKRGLEALIRDDFETCSRLLNAGIVQNIVNPALSEDMRLILARLPRRPEPTSGSQGGEAIEVRTDFSLYTTRH
jgi:tetratricopeptide (TPR) repeat protein